MHLKLIALDLDKTLLHNDNSISDYSIDILTECQQRGIIIAIATARSEYSAKKYLDKINPDVVITSGGAIAKLGNRVIHKALIPQEVLNSIIQSTINHPLINCIRVMGEIHELSNKTGLPKGKKDYGHYDYSDFKEALHEDALKIQFETSDINFLESLIRKYPDCELISYRNENLHKIANTLANKLDAIRSVCYACNIQLAEIAAFGDDMSDFKLLEAVGMGIAVENAVEVVKNVADFVCPSNDEDGVAIYIERYIRGIYYA
ncbi:HAD family hydrolase [Acutalibacter caecimuris]|uniref:HAD family hydrolase n=1 Tax=Acutalibacter caecimuris TaxID=3093657 RepID=UPI002AC8EA24|nr:HAD-IIB family hydrolase [Acutalibacter sp. M00118]